ncbi:hypothetical protein CDL12_11727 [Handroanthus impetiginosus]|uniref:Uncharacterized protein n=1 Tax=Handroanthus impetiginosus TaxID=429701 RepID=A0A2G9HEA8_9LAMI|nr:hypothetical protein CDL12_11727 [Handroanthus impetiginosus]
MMYFPVSNSRTLAAGNSMRRHHPDDEPLQFHKVLQGQQTMFQVHNACTVPSPSPSMLMLSQSSSPSSLFTSLLCGNPKKLETSDLHGHTQMGLSHIRLQTEPLFVDDKNLVSGYNNSCRLFGFPLTEGITTTNKGGNTTPFERESQVLPCNDQQPCHQPPLMTKVFLQG